MTFPRLRRFVVRQAVEWIIEAEDETHAKELAKEWGIENAETVDWDVEEDL